MKDIFLVICGSATSWMMNNIIKNRGGLYNRVTRQILLEPFTLNETEQFLKSKKNVLSRFQIAECYMILGGIPYYLEQLEKSLSLSQFYLHFKKGKRRSKNAENGAQIDLLIDRNDNIINLCEVKYSSKEFVVTKTYDENLHNKRCAFITETNTKKSVHITMITTYGVKHNEYRHNIQREMLLDDLFDP